MIKFLPVLILIAILVSSCKTLKKVTNKEVTTAIEKPVPGTVRSATKRAAVFTAPLKIQRTEFVKYAKSFIGTPYKYGSSEPAKGLDCSGFITVVFNHFDVKVPRSSKDFTNEGVHIDIKNAKPGDIILFTGSDHSTGIVGHMGIITKVGETLQFVHSASGKNVGVTTNNFSGYYKTHFVKIIRILA